MTSALEILRSAQRQLAKLEPRDQDRIIAAIRGLTRNPRPSGSKNMSGRPRYSLTSEPLPFPITVSHVCLMTS